MKILIWHMVGEMVTKQVRVRFYLSCNHSCTQYVSVKMSLVKLQNFQTSACLNLNYVTKQTKKVKGAKIVDLIKLVTNTLTSLILVIFFFFSFIVSFYPPPPPPTFSFFFFFFFSHKMLLVEMGTFPSAWEVMIKTWRSVAWGHG